MKITQLVLASSNQGKLKELNQMLAPLNIDVLPQSDFNVIDVEETGATFVENALLKAQHASAVSGLPALADDSGLVVPALNGAPGIYSARYAQSTPDDAKDDAANNAKLLAELSTLPADTSRNAQFVCVMALCFSEKHPLPLIAQGTWDGVIAHEAYGAGGFGYDPVFIIPDLGITSAELSKEQKNAISHRGKALTSMIAQLKSAT